MTENESPKGNESEATPTEKTSPARKRRTTIKGGGHEPAHLATIVNRPIFDHIVVGDTAPQLEVYASGDTYRIIDSAADEVAVIHFPSGAEEALLAIVIDRLRSKQAGPLTCESNQYALHHAIRALDELKHGTVARFKRGVTP